MSYPSVVDVNISKGHMCNSILGYHKKTVQVEYVNVINLIKRIKIPASTVKYFLLFSFTISRHRQRIQRFATRRGGLLMACCFPFLVYNVTKITNHTKNHQEIKKGPTSPSDVTRIRFTTCHTLYFSIGILIP